MISLKEVDKMLLFLGYKQKENIVFRNYFGEINVFLRDEKRFLLQENNDFIKTYNFRRTKINAFS